MEETSDRTLGLGRRLGERWCNIETARELSSHQLAELKQLVLDLDSEDRFLNALGKDATVSQVFRAYDEFLGVLLDSDLRKHLEELGEAAADSDPVYQKARLTSHLFRDDLLDLFFGKKLNLLTRQYGGF